MFTEDLKVSITFLLDFTELPEQFRNYITIRAARRFGVRFLGSREIEAFTLRDEIEAKAKAIDSDSENADRTIFDNYGFETEILAASVRTANHVKEAALAGADVATIPASVIKSLANHVLTDKGLDQFAKDWAATGQKIL